MHQRAGSHWFVSGPVMSQDAAAVTDQDADFGALTLSGDGGYQVVDTGGNPITNATDVGTGTASGYSLSSGGIITPSSNGGLSAQDAATINISCDQGTATITLSVVADAYSKASADDFADIFTDIGSAGGKTIILRDGNHTAPSISTAFVAEVVIESESYPASITHYEHRTGNACLVGTTSLNAAENVTFRYLKGYFARTGPTANDSASMVFGYTGACKNIHWYRSEIYSDPIAGSDIANSWPKGIDIDGGLYTQEGLVVEECYIHDLSTASRLRASDGASGLTNKITKNRIKDMGNGATSFSGSNIELSWNLSGPFHGNSQETILNHTSQHSYAGVGGNDHQNIEYVGNVAFNTVARNAASSTKLDRVTGNPTDKFTNAKIHGNIFHGVTDNIAVLIDNCDTDSMVHHNQVTYDRISSIENAAITVSGTGALSGDGAGGGDQTIIDVSADSPDLSNVPTDQSYYLLLTTGVTRNVFNIIDVDDTAKTITVGVAPTNPLNSGVVWSISERRSNPGIFMSSQSGGGDTRGVYEANLHCSTAAYPSTGTGEYEYQVKLRTLFTGYIGDGDGSTEDGGLGDTNYAFEDIFDGTSFKAVPEGSLITTFTAKTGGALFDGGPSGVGPLAGYVTWPENFETLPAEGTINGSHPARTPDAFSFDGVDADASEANVESAATQITSIDDGTPVRLKSDADASFEFQVLATNGTTVVTDWTTTETTINNNQYVKVRGDAGANDEDTVSGELIVGNIGASFTITTVVSATFSAPSFVGENFQTDTLTTFTFSAESIGAAPGGSDTRYIVVTASGVRASGTQTITGVTIGGDAMTEAVQPAATDGPTGIYILEVPTGTSADVAVTFSGTMVCCAIGVYQMLNPGSATPTDTDSAISPTSGAYSGALDIPTGGAAIAVAQSRSTAATATSWTGLTEDYDIDASSGEIASGASGGTPGAGVSVVATFDYATITGSMCVASWGP